MSEKWWISTDVLARGGKKVLGPFESQELALKVRGYIETGSRSYWVDSETVTDSVEWGHRTRIGTIKVWPDEDSARRRAAAINAPLLRRTVGPWQEVDNEDGAS